MIRLVNLIFFVGCALAVCHYTGLSSSVLFFAVVIATLWLIRFLSQKRLN